MRSSLAHWLFWDLKETWDHDPTHTKKLFTNTRWMQMRSCHFYDGCEEFDSSIIQKKRETSLTYNIQQQNGLPTVGLFLPPWFGPAFVQSVCWHRHTSGRESGEYGHMSIKNCSLLAYKNKIFNATGPNFADKYQTLFLRS